MRNSHDELVSPRLYSTGKTQEDVVNDVLTALDTNDIVVLRGCAGTGKSAIALHLIKHFTNGIIVVPTKILQQQYSRDYCTNGHFHLDNLLVHYMMGKGNFMCKRTSYLRCNDCENVCSKKLGEHVSRLSVAKACHYWSPVYSAQNYDAVHDTLTEHTLMSYRSVSGTRYFFKAPSPCPYFSQFEYYTQQCALLMNLAKWETETWIQRKPDVPIEIIDEGDEFLDSLTYRVTFSERMFSILQRDNVVSEDVLRAVHDAFDELVDDVQVYDDYLNDAIVQFVQLFIEKLSSDSVSGYVCEKVNKAQLIVEYQQHAFAHVHNRVLDIFLPRPDIALKELLKHSHKVVLMSATMQSEQVLSDVFGIAPPIIDAEPKFPGILHIQYTGREIALTHNIWQNMAMRERYFDALTSLVRRATKPCLVQVHAFKYVPDQYKEQLTHTGFVDNVWWSTKTDRGIDLPDDACRSIVLTKYPLPDVTDIVLKAMWRLLGDAKFWTYVNDIADRNLLQQCGRAIRNEHDWCNVHSPDSKCLARLNRLWTGHKTFTKMPMEQAA